MIATAMRCPQCQTHIALAEVSKRCRCGAKLHLEDEWRWTRGIACAAVDVLAFYRWYPLNGSFNGHVRWLLGVSAAFLLLLAISYRLVPFKLSLSPQDGPLRLDL